MEIQAMPPRVRIQNRPPTSRLSQRTFPALIAALSLSAVLVALLAAGCGGRDASGKAQGGKGGAKGGGFAMPPTPVEAALVSQAPVIERFQAVGSIDAGDAITVVSEIDGTIVKLPFDEGSSVRRGDLIAQLDDSQLKAEVDRTTALRDQAHASFQRTKAVVEQQAGSQQDLDDALSALKVAEANLELAEARLAKTRITAPFEGMVGARRVSPGAFVRAGQAITDLAQIRRLRVTFSAPERYVPFLRQGTEVKVSTTAYPGLLVTGKVTVVEPMLDPSTRSARMVAEVENPEERFRPGMSADIIAVMQQRAQALTIPNEAVFVEGDSSYVYLVKPDSTVKRTAVTLGTRTSEVVEVVHGLSEGETVVRAGHQKLFPGAKVMPVTSGPARQGSEEAE
jgi:membrane fusion protein (multidrug efflux system)